MNKGAPGFEACIDERHVVATSSRRARVAVMVTGAISLVLLSPVLGEVYSSLGTAVHANPIWVLVAVACTVVEFASAWALQRLILRVTRWSDVAGPQLAGNAASNLLPLGSAFGSVIQLRMLTRNGIDLTRAVTSLTIAAMLSTVAALFTFPLLLLLPIGGAANAPVDAVGRFGVIALLISLPLVVVTLRTERPMQWVARAVYNTLRHLPHCRPPVDLAARIVAERDGAREAVARHKTLTVATSVGRALGDYLALYASLLAVGLRPSPAVVLVAFVAANAAGMIPVTPGGLGFVEAGLSGALLLTGAQPDQALAAVAIYRLVSCWLPVLAGVAAYTSSLRAPPVPAPERPRPWVDDTPGYAPATVPAAP